MAGTGGASEPLRPAPDAAAPGDAARRRVPSLLSVPPDIFLGGAYAAALRLLMVALAEGRTLVAVTGAPGLGKTTIVRAALRTFGADRVRVLRMDGAGQDAAALAQAAAELMSRDGAPDAAGHAPTPHGGPPDPGPDGVAGDDAGPGRSEPGILVLEDAHRMGTEALREIGRLATGGPATSRLRIVCVGDETFRDRLAQARFRALDAGVGARVSLSPLSGADSEAYVAHLLRCATADLPVSRRSALHARLMTPKALQEIVEHGEGNPRQINRLVHGALAAATARGQDRVKPRAVRRAAAGLDGGTPLRPGRLRPLTWAAALGVPALALAAAVVVGVPGDRFPALQRVRSAGTALLSAALEPGDVSDRLARLAHAAGIAPDPPPDRAAPTETAPTETARDESPRGEPSGAVPARGGPVAAAGQPAGAAVAASGPRAGDPDAATGGAAAGGSTPGGAAARSASPTVGAGPAPADAARADAPPVRDPLGRDPLARDSLARDSLGHDLSASTAAVAGSAPSAPSDAAPMPSGAAPAGPTVGAPPDSAAASANRTSPVSSQVPQALLGAAPAGTPSGAGGMVPAGTGAPPSAPPNGHLTAERSPDAAAPASLPRAMPGTLDLAGPGASGPPPLGDPGTAEPANSRSAATPSTGRATAPIAALPGMTADPGLAAAGIGGTIPGAGPGAGPGTGPVLADLSGLRPVEGPAAADTPADLLRRGYELLLRHDIRAARQFFERAAASGNAEAARQVGVTYDPVFLGQFNDQGLRPDPAAAASWYRRSAVLANIEAARGQNAGGAPGGSTEAPR